MLCFTSIIIFPIIYDINKPADPAVKNSDKFNYKKLSFRCTSVLTVTDTIIIILYNIMMLGTKGILLPTDATRRQY